MSESKSNELGQLYQALRKAEERLVRTRFAVSDERAIRAAEELVTRARAALNEHLVVNPPGASPLEARE